MKKNLHFSAQEHRCLTLVSADDDVQSDQDLYELFIAEWKYTRLYARLTTESVLGSSSPIAPDQSSGLDMT